MKHHTIRLLIVFVGFFYCAAQAQAVEPRSAHGYYHTLYLTADGKVWAVGRNNYGQLGDGTTIDRTSWVEVDTSGMLGDVVDISCGFYFSMALTSRGYVYVWGDNSYGQCGADPVGNPQFETPRYVTSSRKAIAAGHFHCVSLHYLGYVYSWGRNNYGQLGDDPVNTPLGYSYTSIYERPDVKQIAAGQYHTLMLDADGSVYGMGYNLNGELGRGSTSNFEYNSYTAAIGMPAIRRIAAGGYHSMAIDDEGYIWGWGRNSEGQLGTAGNVDEPTPIRPGGLYFGAENIACGMYHSMMHRVTGEIVLSGANGNGQIGNNVTDGQDVEIPVSIGNDCRNIPRSMFWNSSAIYGDGELRTWGWNSGQHLGNGSVEVNEYAPLSVHAVWPIDDIVSISVGYQHSMGLKADGTLWSWGSNNVGNLGNDGLGVDEPIAVQTYNGSGITSVRFFGGGSGANHSMVNRTDGQSYGFGLNQYGELESVLGTHAKPLSMSLNYAQSISCGQDHTSYINWDGNIYTTGYNNVGQLGFNYPTTSTFFGVPSNPGTARAIQTSCGTEHTMALLADGRVLTWGGNTSGQCGEIGGPFTTPIIIQRDVNGDSIPDGDLIDIIAIAAGGWHGVALDVDGYLWTWGTNSQGRTGQGTTSGTTTYATRITSTSGFTKIAGGRWGSAAVQFDGDVYTWGDNQRGQCGNNTTGTDLTVPTLVGSGEPFDNNVVDIAMSFHTVVLTGDGRVFSVGEGNRGKLGTGNLSDTGFWDEVVPNWFPEIDIDVSTSFAFESGAQATFQVNRYLNVPGTLETKGIVDVEIDPDQGVAVTGVDLVAMPTTIRIEPNSTTAAFPVSAVDDLIDEDTEGIEIWVDPGEKYQVSPSNFRATGSVIDNDTAGIDLILQTAPVSSESGAYAYYLLSLRTEPTSPVTITMATSDTTECLLDVVNTSQNFVFNAGNWSNPQFVYMDGIDDFVVDGDVNVDLVNTNITGDPKYAALSIPNQTVTNQDNDFADIVVTSISNDTDEDGTSGTFQVYLTSEPVDDVTIDISSSNLNEGSVSPTSVTFDAGNWSSGFIITVTGEDDPIDDGAIPYTIKLDPDTGTSDPNYVNMDPPDVAVLNYDNDTADITVSLASNDTEEDGTQATFTVVLDTQPITNVTIPISSDTPAEITVNPTILTFTPANWDTPQVVTLTGIDDFRDDDDQFVTIITGIASGDATYTGINPDDVTLYNIDDDTADALPSKFDLAVTEGGVTDTYSIVLLSEPIGGNVTVDIVQHPQVVTDKTQLTFTPGNWNVPQWVVATAVDDFVAETSPELDVPLTHNFSGADYDGIGGDLDVDITDNDVPSLIYSQNPITVVEGGSGFSYSVRLATEPTDTVDVTIDANAEVLVDGGAQVVLSFDAGNWNIAQFVTVTAIDDPIIEGSPHAGDISYSITSGDPFYDGLGAPVFTVNVTDNDVAGINIAPVNITTGEPNLTDQFLVTLTSQPSNPVTVGLSSSDSTEGTPDVPNVILHAGNWNTGVLVGVTGADDVIDDGNVAYQIITAAATSADGDYSGINPVDVNVINNDNDTAGVTVVESGGSTLVTEDGINDTYTVVLNTEPTTTVTITVTPTGGLSVDKPTLTFTPGNWSTAQTVTVSAIDDPDVEGPHFGTVTHSASGNEYTGVGIAAILSNITDNDTATAQVSAISGNTNEDGTSATFSIVLDSRPTNNVTFGLSSSTPTEAAPAVGSVIFTNLNWNVPQVITVNGVDDDVIDGPIGYTIVTAAATSADSNYNGYNPNDVTGFNDDDDVAGINLVETGGTTNVTESGGTDTYSFVLTAEPDSNVTINFTHNDPTNGTSDGSGGTLIFTPGNWDTVQHITISAIDDAVVEGGHSVTISHSISTSDINFGALPNPGDVTVNITDNDNGSLVIAQSGGTTTVKEDIPAIAVYGDSIDVSLSAEPSGTVTVTFVDVSSELVFSTPSLDFTPGNWNSPVTIYVSGQGDGTVDPGLASMDFTCTGGAYDGVISSISVWVIDSDTDAVIIDESAGSTGVDEDFVGVPDTYTIVLDSPPSVDPTTVTISNDGQLSTDIPTAQFTALNWYIPQTVTVSVVDDSIDETDPHTGTLTHTVDNGYAGGTAPSVVANIFDNDNRGVTITEIDGAGTTVDEDTPAAFDRYEVVLDSEPTGTVTISINGTQVLLDKDVGSDGTGVSESLTFNAGNWSTPQRIRVYSDDDSIQEADPHAGNITHSASGADYTGVGIGSVAVTVYDNDTAGVTVDTAGLSSISEAGTTTTFTVVLDTQPTDSVNVNLSSDDTSEGTVSPSALTFTTGNWSTPQIVTVTGVDDAIVDGNIGFDIDLANPVSSDGNYSSLDLSGDSVAVTNNDNDTPNLIYSANPVVVTEGGSGAAFTVRLATQPFNSVDVTFTSTSQVAVAGSPDTLTFTTGNWNVGQTVNILAVDDNVIEGAHADGLIASTSSTDGFYDGITPTTLNVNITDNDTAAVIVSPTSLTTGEDGTQDTFTVTLSSIPANPVTVTFSSDNTSEGTISPASVILDNTDWNTGEIITVTGVNDVTPAVDGNVAYHIDRVSVTSSDTNYNALGAVNDVIDVTNVDDDVAGVTVTGSPVAVTEGGSHVTYSVVLDTQPPSNVTININGIQVDVDKDSGSDGFATTETLTFTNANWNTAQLVRVLAIDDNDIEGAHIGTVTHSASGGGYDSVIISSVTANITDNDNATATVTAITGNTGEDGTTATFTIVLDSKPTDDVTIGLSSDNTNEGTVSPSSVTFTPFNWNSSQLITVTGVDGDALIDGTVGYNIVIAAATSLDTDYNGYNHADVAANNDDNDVAAVVITESGGSTDITEGGATDTYTIVLTSEPTVNVTININHADAVNGTADDQSGSVVFTPSNWFTAQTVTVSAVDDGTTENAHDKDIDHSITTTDTDYSGLGNPATVTAHISDNDAPGLLITQSGGSTDVVEDVPVADGDTFDVSLLTLPGATVTVTFVDTDGELTFNPASLDFTTGNYASPQTVQVTGTGDAVVDGGTATLDMTCANGGYGAVTGQIVVNVTDSDTDGITIVQTSGTTDVVENGATDTYTVVLDSPPSSPPTTVTIGNADGELSPSSGSLVFTALNWYTPQIVTVTAVNDAVDEDGLHNGTLTHTPDAGYDGGSAGPSVVANITDDDSRGVTISKASVTVNEGTPATFDTYTVVLTSEPTAAVNITVTGNQVDVDDAIIADGQATTVILPFTTGNWSTPQTVRVYPNDDSVDEANPHAGNITHTASGGDYGPVGIASVSATVFDDDAAGVTINTAGLSNTTEAGGATTFTVVLDTQPTDSVSINLSSDDTGEGTVSPSTLTFTTGNWSSAQTVTVTGADDAIVDGNIAFNIDLANPLSSDSNYSSLDLSGDSVAVTNNDDDTADLIYSANPVAVTEGGSGTSFTVRLATAPSNSVDVTFTSTSQVSVTDSPDILTFTTGNWNVAQTVNIAAIDDNDVEGAHADSLIATTSSSDTFYNGITPTTLTVNITDNDTASVIVSPTSLTTGEDGTSDTFTVTLSSIPTAAVTVTFVSDDTNEGTISPASVILDNSDWNTGEVITVTGVNDTPAEVDGNVAYNIDRVSVTSSDTDYNALGAVGDVVNVVNNDDDVAGVTIVEIGGASTDISEAGGVDTYSVVLDTRPPADVTITVTALGGTSVDKPSLTFTNGNWNSAQIVTVSAIDDNDVEGAHAGTITHSASGGGYDAVIISSVTANITDNDTATATVSSISGNTNEDGTTATFTVVLDAKPTDDVTIGLSSDDTSEGTVSPASLTFTPFNWNTTQLVTVTGVDDALIDGPIGFNIITAAASSLDTNFNTYNAADVAVTNDDDDSAGVTITEIGGTTDVTEGGATDTYTIVLNSQPVLDVTINIVHVDGTNGTADDQAGAVTFNSTNWFTARTVTVSAVDDAAAEGAHTSDINHTITTADTAYGAIGNPASITVNITDNESGSIIIAESSGSTDVVEDIPVGNGDTIDVTLSAPPSGTVTVTLTDTDGELTFNPSPSLTFTPGNYNVVQTVSITGTGDGSVDPGVARLDLSCAGGGYAGVTATVNVNVTDSDTPGVTVVESGGSTDLDEANVGATDTYTVVLDSPPGGSINVNVGNDGETSPSPSTLTFTNADWFVPQTVTVTVVDDGTVETDPHTGVISNTPVGYAGGVGPDVNASINDNDSAGVLITESGTTDVTEGGVTDTFDIVLTSSPTNPVTITATDTQVTTSTIAVFNSGNWNSPQTITVTAVDDVVDEGSPHAGGITFAAASTDTDYNGIGISSITVNITDNDTALVVVDTTGTVDVDESGTATTFTVVLDTQPTDTVSINVSSSDLTEATVSPSVLTFTTGNWNTAQTITVTGVDDSIVDGTVGFNVQLSAPSSSDTQYAALGASNVPLNTTDDDVLGISVIETAGSTLVLEQGTTTDSISIVLDSEPVGGGGVTVTVQHSSSQVLINGGVSDTLNFTAANWSSPQSVTLTAVDDALAELNPHNALIELSAVGDDYTGVTNNTFNAQVQDNDQASITATPQSGLSVTEAGGTDTFDVVLDTAPSATVTVTVASSDATEASASPATLTFTTGDWNVAQTVTVTGVDDSVDDGDITYDIDLTAASTDPVYNGVAGTAEVTTVDDDTVGIIATPLLGLTTTETGNVAVFIVYLAAEPSADVVLDLNSSDLGEGTPSVTQLTFTTATWQFPQIVTVSGVDDLVADGDIPYSLDISPNVALTIDAQYDGVANVSVQLQNVDDDIAGVEIAETAGSTAVVEAGATDTYDVRLDTQPTGDVTISLTPESGEVSVSPTSLTFTSGNWNSYQTVTVTAVNDDVQEIIAPHTDNILHSASGGGYDAVLISDLGISITDNDSAGLVITPNAVPLSMPEDASSTDSFTLKLSSEPSALVIVNITVDDASEASVTPSLLTFTPSASSGTSGHWDFDQTVTVTGIDDNIVDGTVAYTISVDTVSGDTLYNGQSGSINAETTDDDTLGITVSTAALTVAETGTSATYSVVLDSEPLNDVTINVSSDDATEGTLDTSVLSFNSTNWNSPQFVKVTGVDDDIDDGDQVFNAVIDAAASGDANYNGIDPTDVSVTNTDDDTASVVITPSGGFTSVSEAGLTDTYDISLATEPTAPVTIVIADDGELSPSSPSVTFTAGDWNVPQTITVTAVNDNISEGSHSGTLSHSSTDVEYNGVTIADVTANIDDDDEVDIIVTPTDGLITGEDGTTAAFTVELSSEPTADVTIAVSSDTIAEGTVSTASLTFTSANWNVQQTVTVTGVDDLLDDGDQSYTIVLASATSSDANYNNYDPNDVSVTNLDDDGAAVSISTTNLSISEAGTADSYTVVLDSQPPTDVTITLSADLTNVGLSATTLTFTNGNWDTAQTVTVSAVDDLIAEGIHAIVITHTASGGGYDGVTISDVTASITDNDTAGVTVNPTSGLTTDESGSTDTFTVVLDSEPTSSVTIAVTSLDTSEATVSPASLTFTTSNWNTAQTVTVTGVDDAAADGNVLYTVELADAVSDDDFYGGASPINPSDVTGTNTDDEIAGITVTPTSGLTTTEGGGSAVFTVRLNTQPTDDVVINLASDDLGEGTALPATLTFTNGNWNNNQTVTVTGVNDDIDDDNQPYNIVLSPATSSDGNYNNFDPADVSVTNVDDDSAGFVVTPTSGLVTGEAGVNANFTVVLTSEPTDDVSFNLSSTNTAEGTVAPGTLTFTSGNWSTPQTVTVSGVDDGSDDGDVIYSITTDAATSTDTNYNGLNPDDVSVTNQDDDGAAINIVQTGGSTDISEAGTTSDTYTVVLATLPTGQVDVTISDGGTGQVSVSPSVLTFQTTDWFTPQVVTVTAIDDATAEGLHAQTITHSASSGDGNYDSIAINNVTANITDNDTAAIIVSPVSGLVTTEAGGTDTFTVVLGTQPTADVTIPISSGDGTEGSVSTGTLTFNSGNWNTPQTVTVTGVNDALDDGPIAFNIVLSASSSADGQYDGINANDVAVSNSDDDGVEVIFAESSGSTDVSEDGIVDSYTAVLNSQPVDDVVVTAVAGPGLNVTPSSLTFTTANWDTAQSFAVSAIDDAIAEGTHFDNVTHTAASTGDTDYNGLALSNISVTITDNDNADIFVTPTTGLVVNENGDSDTFTVVLTSEPTANVTVALSSDNGAEGTVSPASLTFTNANWFTAQTVTVNGVDDGASVDGDVVFNIVTGTAASSDANYAAINPSDVSVTNQDNDQPTVIITMLDNLVDEANAGDTGTYQLSLSSAPAPGDDVDIDIVTDSNANYAGGTLTFTDTTYNVPQLVTITAVDDQIAEGTHLTTVAHTITTVDVTYTSVTASNVVLSVADDDVAGIDVTPTTGLETNEIGGTDTFDVVLLSQPTADVTITVNSSNTAQGTVSTALLTFTSGNWSSAQTVIITGEDANSTDDGDVLYTIITGDAGSADPNYNGMSVADVDVTNRSVNNEPTLAAVANENITEDDPTQLIILTGISDGQTGEGQTLTISATSNNTSLVPNPSILDNGDGTADLTYTPALNQFGTATITVTVQDNGGTAGAGDDDTVQQTFDINVAADNDLPDINVASTLFNGELVALVATTGATNAISNVELYSTDVEDSDPTLTYTLVLRPGQGDVRNNNSGLVINPGETWLQSDIDNNYIEYVHGGGPGGVTDGFAFTVADGSGGESAEVFQIYVDRTAPSLALNATDLVYTENDGVVPIDNAAVVVAGNIDPFDNGYLLVEWTAGQTANDNLVLGGGITVDIAGVVTLPGAIVIGNVDTVRDGQNGNDLLINFVTTTPTSANVLTLVRGVSYQNDDDDPSAVLRTVQMTLNDGFLDSGAVSRNIDMQPQNDSPVIGSTTFGTILNVDINSFLPVSDPDGTIISITATTPSLGSVSIVDPATGSFLYQPTPGLSGSDSFDITVTDNLGAVTIDTINIEITDVNTPHLRVISDPPMFALDGDILVYTPTLDTVLYTPGAVTYELINKPAGLSDPNSFGTISWDLTGLGGQTLRFSYLIRDGSTVGIQPVMIQVLAPPGGGG